jgi:hypothetical protein
VLGSFGVPVVYQCYVGGDVWPLSRFVIPVVAGLFILAAEGMRDHRPMLVEVDGTKVGLRARSRSPKINGGRTLGWDTAQKVADAIIKAKSDSAG